MPLVSGGSVGHYEVGAHLGAGGMGEVYQARDTTLGRDVAIKILPEAFARDRDQLARLEREAKVLASLNHPHIAAIYSLEAVGDQRLLVMELVPGKTLAERLETGCLPLDEALAFARQMALALEAAHASGIIHRDLKPANIKITPDDKIKLLDFGLAKGLGEDSAGVANLSYSPTIAAGATGAGVILGTAPYMSPEQARGKRVDNRTDIWAFGCVLYEMLASRKAFPGDTVTDALAAVVRAEPDWQLLPSSTPTTIRSLLRRCLQKDTARRLHHIADARIEIEETMAAPLTSLSATQEVHKRMRWVRAAPWALTAAMAVALVVIAVVPRRNISGSRDVARFELSLPAGVELYSGPQSVAFSPDGTRIAYVGVQGGTRQLYVRRLDQFEAQTLRGTEGAASCFFAPDGRSIGSVMIDGNVKRVSLADGLVVTVSGGADILSGAAWGPDDSIVFAHAGTLCACPPREERRDN